MSPETGTEAPLEPPYDVLHIDVLVNAPLPTKYRFATV